MPTHGFRQLGVISLDQMVNEKFNHWVDVAKNQNMYSIHREREKFMKKIFLVLFISTFMALSSFASDNLLQTVQIEPLGDSFNIVLVSDSTVPVKRTVQSPNRILLSLKGINASEELSTVYKNVSNVDSVIVEPFGNDGLNIMFQADNASNAKITFDSLVSSVNVTDRANPKTEILLNAPMNTYSPIYKNEDSTKTSSSVITKSRILSALALLKPFASNAKISTLFTMGFFGLIFLLGVKLINGKNSDISVGLSQSLRDRDIANTKLVPNMTGGYKNALNKPHTSMNYGLKAYQNSTPASYNQTQRPIGNSAPSIHSKFASMPKRNLMSASIQQPLQETKMPQRQSVQRTSTSAYTQNTLKTQQPKAAIQSSVAKSRVDNVKFLESMSQIYEKSGRPDLANGIRTKLSNTLK